MRLRDQQAPIALFGLGGLIHRPSTSTARFESVQQIDSLFDSIELRATLLVQIADLWLPNFLVDLVRHLAPGGSEPVSEANREAH